MKERPILFSSSMVRAILDGSKTQTRRVVKPRRCPNTGCELACCEIAGERGEHLYRLCPYGAPGDRLWVKETTVRVEDLGWIGPIYAESDEGRQALEWGYGEPDDPDHIPPHAIKLRPSLFMPRTRSRILLEITDVRVEKLQDISEDDARAEGMCVPNCECGYGVDGAILSGTASGAFMLLWEQIYSPDSWVANPWVWVVTFRRVEP
jgi:hypothetical protein